MRRNNSSSQKYAVVQPGPLSTGSTTGPGSVSLLIEECAASKTLSAYQQIWGFCPPTVRNTTWIQYEASRHCPAFQYPLKQTGLNTVDLFFYSLKKIPPAPEILLLLLVSQKPNDPLINQSSEGRELWKCPIFSQRRCENLSKKVQGLDLFQVEVTCCKVWNQTKETFLNQIKQCRLKEFTPAVKYAILKCRYPLNVNKALRWILSKAIWKFETGLY